MVRRVEQVVVELGQMHDILGDCAASMESRGFELDVSFVVGAVLGDNIGGAGGGVGYWGLLGALGYVLHDWVGTSGSERGQMGYLSVVP